MTTEKFNHHFFFIIIFLHLFPSILVSAQVGNDNLQSSAGIPIIFRGDTLFDIQKGLGAVSVANRASAIQKNLEDLFRMEEYSPDSIKVVDASGFTKIEYGSLIIMAVVDDDTIGLNKTRQELAQYYASTINSALNQAREQYSAKSILYGLGVAIGLFILASAIFWFMRKFFNKIYTVVEKWEGAIIRSVKFRSREIISAANLDALIIVLLKGIRLAITLAIIYYFLTITLSLLPWTHSWNIQPILSGLLFTIIVTAAAIAIFKTVTNLFKMILSKVDGWKGTLIKPVKIKTVELLSEERIAEITKGAATFIKIFIIVVLVYFYITIVFSFFIFTRTWASTLIGYILNPLWKVILSFINYLPNLFFILVIVTVTRYVIKFIKLIFDEIGKGAITLPRFYREWADPTFKIVRFLIIAFSVIVIFPYLPGSDSPVFQGISVFLGVLFSLGSTSAIANIVGGVVLTYMRPFKIGDRVKIADTIGDVVEKTLLVTRVRTIKNVDITIPNAMVLGSHIINFSSSAEDRGLILHTGVTIGYNAPWKKVHELLIAAANATENILKEPKPFILQTSLDDHYVRYELNAFTDKPNIMAKIYSDLHQNIQDKFNEDGVEIMSPHYSAVRDGNQTTIPENYLPKSYQAPAFRIFPLGNQGQKPDSSSK